MCRLVFLSRFVNNSSYTNTESCTTDGKFIENSKIVRWKFDVKLVSMLMNHSGDLRRIFVVDLYVDMVYSQVNRQFVVCNRPIDLPEDHRHRGNIPHVFYNHLCWIRRIAVHIVCMFYNVQHPFRHLEHRVHHREAIVILKVQQSSRPPDLEVVLERVYVLLER